MGTQQKLPELTLTVQECRERIASARALVVNSQALRETASDLRQYNAELRELLREFRLAALSLRERWVEDLQLSSEEISWVTTCKKEQQ